MKIIRNKIIPYGWAGAINLFGLLFVKEDMRVDEMVINHERIHSAQMREMLYLPFYLAYAVEWLWRFARLKDGYKAYRWMTFEREAYDNQRNYDYLSGRRHFAQWRKTANTSLQPDNNR